MSAQQVIAAVAAVGVDGQAARLEALWGPGASLAAAPPTQGPGGFARLLADGVEAVDRKLAKADAMVSAYAVDDTVPLHQVTYALEDARLAFELTLQVRSRLLEAYQELSRMQL